MSRTPGERSRGGRSPRADRAGRIGGRARQIHWCRKLSCWLCQQATADSQMKPGTIMKLGRFSDVMMEQFMMSRHQHKPAASTKLHVAAFLVAPHLLSTRKASSKLAMSSSSNAAVSETVARRAMEPRSPHIRHGGRERRDRYLPPAIAPRWRSFSQKNFANAADTPSRPSVDIHASRPDRPKCDAAHSQQNP